MQRFDNAVFFDDTRWGSEPSEFVEVNNETSLPICES